MFCPGLNPARITTAINWSVSLFTSSISYGSLVSELQRPLLSGCSGSVTVLTDDDIIHNKDTIQLTVFSQTAN